MCAHEPLAWEMLETVKLSPESVQDHPTNSPRERLVAPAMGVPTNQSARASLLSDLEDDVLLHSHLLRSFAAD